jgi:acyl dehydratase
MQVGDRVPEIVRGPIDRGTLALFAGASNDHVLLHIDSDFAKSAGMPDVFAHGMLSMAYLAQMLTSWSDPAKLRHWGVRFTAITPLYATVRCSGEVIEVFEAEGERRARLKLAAHIDGDVQTLDGEAIVAI